MLKSLLILIISFQLQAGVTAQMNYDFKNAMGGSVAPNTGDTYSWGNGVLTRNSDGSLSYASNTNSSSNTIIRNDSDLKELARNSADVRKTWVEQYGVDALGTKDSYDSSKASINSLLAKPGKANSSAPIDGMNAMVYFDGNGNAKNVIMSDGTSMSVNEFMNSKEFEAKVGTHDSEEELADVSSKSGSNSVPENFNGDVYVTPTKDSEGNYKILSGISDVAGGPFNRAYNGVSGTAPATPPLSEFEYNEKMLILTAQIWGITEIGEKMCKPLGKDFPKSISNWWLVVKNYVEAEKKRDLLTKKRAEGLKAVVMSTTTKAGGNSSIQLEGLKMQIESLNIAIDSLSGSSLFSGDKKAGDARATSRLAWREALLVATFQGIEDSKAEDSKAIAAYNTCNIGIDQSLQQATSACNRKKNVDCAVDKIKECGDKDSGIIVVADPVPGSCEMKNKNLPLLQKIAMKDLATLYGVSPIPSKEMNERLIRITNFIKKEVNVLFPKSNDSKFDWSAPLKVCVDPLVKPIKNNGITCPANASDKDYDKTKFEKLGKSDDPISEMSHYTCGDPNTPSSPSYANTNSTFQNSLKTLTDDKKINDGTKSKEDLQNMALQSTWNMWTSGPYSENFLAGKNIDAGINKKAEREFADSINKQFNVSDGNCSNPEICKPNPDLVKNSSIPVPSPKEVTQNARLFLGAMGISESSIEDSAKLLSGYWNINDLYMGQSNIRQTYFTYNQKLISDLVLADRNKLAQMLIDRKKLIDAYTDLKKILDDNAGKTGTGGSGMSGVASTGSSTSLGGTTELASDKLKALTVAGPIAFSNTAGGFDPASMLSLDKGSNGRLTFASSNGTGTLSENGSTNAYSISQGKKINQSKDNIKKLTKDISGQIAKSKYLKNADENKANSNFERLASVNSKAGNSSFVLGGSGSSSGQDSSAATKTENKGTVKLNNQLDNPYVSGSASSSESSGSNSGQKNSNNGQNNSNDSYGQAKSQSLMGKGQNYAALTDDQKRVLEAIYARDRESKNRYDKKENDSLFEQITKAHIRNLERIQN